MHDLIQEVNIPMETVTEITDNGPKTVERKVFPGYVLVKMVMTDETWHLVRNIRGVTGFVGSANKAIPLTDDEIAAPGRGKARGGGVLRRWATTSRSPTAPWSPLWAPWRSWTWTGARSGWSYPCSAGRLPVELELDQVEPVERLDASVPRCAGGYGNRPDTGV